jgi:AcrR family transcriptional regulator
MPRPVVSEIDGVLARSGNPATIERGQETRALLVGAAIEVIARDGWGGMTTRKVARQAGVNPGLVHYHFGAVSALARQAALQAMGVVFEPVATVVSECDELLQGLDLALRATLSFDPVTVESRVVLEATVQAMRDPELAKELRKTLVAFRSMLAQRLEVAQEEGSVAGCLDPVGVSVLIAAVIDGVGLHHLLDPAGDLAAARPALRAMLEASR